MSDKTVKIGSIERKIPETVWHYTKGDVLLSLLSNEEFWASHIRYMNDTQEFIEARKVFSELIDATTNLRESKEAIMKYLEDAHKDINIFVVSFTEKEDDLNQWRGYTNSGLGVSIGFDTEKLLADNVKIEFDFEHFLAILDKLVAIKDNESYFEMMFLPCFYEPDEIKKILSDVVSNIDKNDLQKIAERLYYYSPMIKHESFKDEAEWRLVVFLTNKKVNICDKLKDSISESVDLYKKISSVMPIDIPEKSTASIIKCEKKEIVFRASKSYFVPYLKTTLPIKSAVKEIYITPCADTKTSKDSVEYMLKCNSLNDVILENSSIPYRN